MVNIHHWIKYIDKERDYIENNFSFSRCQIFINLCPSYSTCRPVRPWPLVNPVRCQSSWVAVTIYWSDLVPIFPGVYDLILMRPDANLPGYHNDFILIIFGANLPQCQEPFIDLLSSSSISLDLFHHIKIIKTFHQAICLLFIFKT